MDLADVLKQRFEILKNVSNEEEISNLWSSWTFPLARTSNFEDNWIVITDPSGPFTDEFGQRLSVRPQNQAASRFSPDISDFVYRAILFSKVAYRWHIKDWHSGPLEQIIAPPIVERWAFINAYVSKFPSHWREAILENDLHRYTELRLAGSAIADNLYSPLSHIHHIRLIALLPTHPNKSHSRVRCLLGEESFDTCPPYKALSYVWGDASVTRPIDVNSTTFQATENLEAALKALRSTKGEIIILWIDAICINQNDHEEKGHQVSRMGRVYENAEEVVVWLGKESHRTAPAMEAIKVSCPMIPAWFPNHFPFQHEHLCAECGKFGSALTIHKERKAIREQGISDDAIGIKLMHNVVTSAQQLAPQYQSEEGLITLVESISALMQRAWWQRVWVIQEFALASKITFRCGSVHTEWSKFRSLVLLLIRIGQRSAGRRDLNSPNQYATAFQSLTENFFGALPFLVLSPPDREQDLDHRYRPTLAKLLALTVKFKATNPRDYIYALLGTLAEDSEERKLIVPDYNAPPRKIFIRLTKYFLESSGTLDALSARPPMNDALSEQALPSWVPDWAIEDLKSYGWGFISVGEFSTYKAISSFSQKLGGVSGSSEIPVKFQHIKPSDKPFFSASLHKQTPIPFRFSPNQEVLNIHGVRVDRIKMIGIPFDRRMRALGIFQQHDVLPFFHHVLDFWKKMCGVNELSTYGPTGESLIEVFWRTILVDRFWKKPTETQHDSMDTVQRLPPVHEMETLRDFFGDFAPKQFPPKTPEDEEIMIKYILHEKHKRTTYNGWSCHCASQSMFTTEKGYIGVCSLSAKPGDSVAVLLGGSVPFILRQYGDYHLIVCESFVHGIMDGQVIERCQEQGENNPYFVEEFSIA